MIDIAAAAADRLAALLDDESVKAEIRERGFAQRPLLTHLELDRARSLVADLGGPPDNASIGRWTSAECEVDAYRRSAAAVVREVIGDPFGVVDESASAVVVIWPGPDGGSGVGAAGDPERDSLVLEVALDATDHHNGHILVVPMSHRWPALPPNAASTELAELATRYSVDVLLDAGDVLICHPAIVRCSLPSRVRPVRELTASLRAVALSAAFMPADRSAGDFDLGAVVAAGRCEVRAAAPSGVANPGARSCIRCGRRNVELPTDPWRRLGPVVCAVCETTELVVRDAPGPLPSGAPDTLPLPALRRRRVLRDEELDERLRRDGYVVVPTPVLSAPEAAALRERFGELHGWDGEGHLNDFNHRDLTYRSAAVAAMRDALSEPLDGLFCDFSPFLSTFLCKWPGDDGELEPHQDWTYVDEVDGDVAVLAFVALDPVGPGSGQVRVLRGSHLVDAGPRGSALRASWLAHTDVVEERLTPIELEVGQCVVWDSATVHSSMPNRTARPRLAAGMWMAHRDAHHVHHRRQDGGTAVRMAIDPSFYAEQNPYRLLVFRPSYPVEAVVAVEALHPTPEELAAVLPASTAAFSAAPDHPDVGEPPRSKGRAGRVRAVVRRIAAQARFASR